MTIAPKDKKRLSNDIIQYRWVQKLEAGAKLLFVLRIDDQHPQESRYGERWVQTSPGVKKHVRGGMPMYPSILLEVSIARNRNDHIGYVDLTKNWSYKRSDEKKFNVIIGHSYGGAADINWSSSGGSRGDEDAEADVNIVTGEITISDFDLRRIGLAGYLTLQDMTREALELIDPEKRKAR